MRLAIVGMGRMGREVDALATERGVTVAARLGGAAAEDRKGALELLATADVAIEFTTPHAAVGNIDLCVEAGCPVVVGTTGWYDRLPEVRARVEKAGGALLWAPNFSLGAAMLKLICARAGALLRAHDDFDVHITETHHVHKRDAPSGTAIMLRDELAAASGREIDVTSIRVGHVPGRHEVSIDGPYESITLAHEARNRRVFADGALRAAAWLRGRTGVFTMEDVLTMEETS
jgi:4-hydroxy-tetrahydrodipicolinate reductase